MEIEPVRSLELNKSYPAHSLAISWTEPYVVRVGEAYLDWEVWADTVRVRVFQVNPLLDLE